MPQTQRAYFDAALIAKYYLKEPGRDVIRDLSLATGRVVSSAVAAAEISGAFHRNFRDGRMDASMFTALQEQFAQDLKAGLWVLLPVTESLLDDVRDLFSTLNRTVYLRALDALHLVTAKAHRFDRLYTNDRHLLAACPKLGITPINPLA